MLTRNPPLESCADSESTADFGFSAETSPAGGATAILCCPTQRGRAVALAAAWITSQYRLFPSVEAAVAWAAVAGGGAPLPGANSAELAALRSVWAPRRRRRRSTAVAAASQYSRSAPSLPTRPVREDCAQET